MKLQGILFDLDGTLANTLPVCLAAFQETFLHFTGQHYSYQEIEALFGPSEIGILQAVLKDQAEQAYPYWLELYSRLHKVCPAPYPGLRGVLMGLRERKVRVGIVTGKGPESARLSVERLGLAPLIEQLETGLPEEANKPAAFRKILKAWNLAPAEVAYVGDTLYDMRAARSEGLLALGAGWAPTNTLQGEADHLFPSVTSFYEWLGYNTSS